MKVGTPSSYKLVGSSNMHAVCILLEGIQETGPVVVASKAKSMCMLSTKDGLSLEQEWWLEQEWSLGKEWLFVPSSSAL